MNSMKVIPPTSRYTWLRTDEPVVPVNPSAWDHLREVESALQKGVEATTDAQHPGFYEIEVGDTWYYIHVPSRLRAVYLVAVQNRATAKGAEILARTAC